MPARCGRPGRLGAIGRALVPRAAAAGQLGKYSIAEVAMHSTTESGWVVVDGEVYDVTSFLDEHPGGKALLLSVAGTDATTTFNGIHPDLQTALREGEAFKIGIVVSEEEAPPPTVKTEEPAPSDQPAAAVDGEVHFHLPDSIKDMAPEQLAALSVGAVSAATVPAKAPASSAVATKRIATDTEGLSGSEAPSWNSGGTAGALPAERALASFDVELMTNILDGGEEETKKRRWIIGAGDIAASSELFGAAKYDLPRDGSDGAIASAFEHFMRVHGPWLEQMYVPTGNETMYMSMGNMMGGCALPRAARAALLGAGHSRVFHSVWCWAVLNWFPY